MFEIMQIFVIILLFVSYSSLTASAPSSELASRIVNGYEIDISEIPYQAALQRRAVAGWAHSCGAVIIHEKAALTAAHCLYYETSESRLRVNVGTSSRESGGTSYDVIQAYIHHMYRPSSLRYRENNDIAMLVTRSMQFDRTVKPIGFATPGFSVPDGMEAIVSGFGLTSEGGMPSPVLLAAKVQIVNQATCLRAYWLQQMVTSGMICASASNPARDSCQQDSGGPLVANGTLIGLVSWGEGCGNINYPGVYTRVSEYSHWIKSLLSLIDEGVFDDNLQYDY